MCNDHELTEDDVRSAHSLSAVTVARAFEVMLPARQDLMTLEHNPHRYAGSDQSAKDFLSDFSGCYEYTGPVEQQKIEATNELWSLEWTDQHGTTTKLAAATLQAIAQWLQDQGLAFGS